MHAKQSKERLRKKKLQYVEYLGGRCIDCKQTYPSAVFDFHHRNRDEKDFEIADIEYVWEIVKVELDKCDLLCSNCHRIRHIRD